MSYTVKIYYSDDTTESITFDSQQELKEYIYLEGDHILYYEDVIDLSPA